MNFTIPRKNNSEMLLYIWKVIDIPLILYEDLFYKISFEFFLFPPEEAKIFINHCIDNKILVKIDNKYLKLANELNEQMINWQKKRRIEIVEKIKVAGKIKQLETNISKKSSKFSVLIGAFVDKGTLNRSVSVSDEAFELLEYDQTNGIIKSKVAGTKQESYILEINVNNKILRHNCHDFESRRAGNKKFCKHIAKLFLLLKEKNDKSAEYFLNELAEDIDNWDFTT
jgi:hypothetical protein